jgi:hypothetical protein
MARTLPVSTADEVVRFALTPFEDRRQVEPRWSKGENWRIVRRMTNEDLYGTDLGRFLEAL